MSENSSNKIPPGLVILGVLLVGGLGFAGTKFFSPGHSAVGGSAVGVVSAHSADSIAKVFNALPGDMQIRYKELAQDLSANKWKRANEATTEVLLQAAGPIAQSTGAVPKQEMATLPAADLHAVDDLWTAGSHGRWGFTAQETILHGKAGHDWKALYHKLGWDEIKMVYSPSQRRFEFAPGHEPDWDDIHTGELPTFERQYNFAVSLDARLAAVGIVGVR